MCRTEPCLLEMRTSSLEGDGKAADGDEAALDFVTVS